ncbi:uncharacterized protein LOC116416215 [Nasonia vitripennis]|uniref:Uncharacterized protein n=1 Tax=Nasonia vitripennis TaxID=7425 RepID=A0A7M7Q0V1_NASVI|nr:uncharacterized protein LOC116416215 [Nasonia vitripennis]
MNPGAVEGLVGTEPSVQIIGMFLVSSPFERIPLVLEELDLLHDTLVEAVFAGKLSPVYGRNLLEKRVESLLGNMPLHLDPNRNLAICCGDGINKVTFYLAG